MTVSVAGSEEVFTVYAVINSTVIGSLEPFTTYTCTVAAVTVAGTGPYSPTITFVTDEAGLCNIYLGLTTKLKLPLCSSQQFT